MDVPIFPLMPGLEDIQPMPTLDAAKRSAILDDAAEFIEKGIADGIIMEAERLLLFEEYVRCAEQDAVDVLLRDRHDWRADYALVGYTRVGLLEQALNKRRTPS